MKLDSYDCDVSRVTTALAVPCRRWERVMPIGIECFEKMDCGNQKPNFISYGLSSQETFEFPETKDEVILKVREIRAGCEYLIFGLKNRYKYGWFSIGHLYRKDCNGIPVHPLAKALENCRNDRERIEMCLGKTIVADGEVTYEPIEAADRIVKERTIAKLRFE